MLTQSQKINTHFRLNSNEELEKFFTRTTSPRATFDYLNRSAESRAKLYYSRMLTRIQEDSGLNERGVKERV